MWNAKKTSGYASQLKETDGRASLRLLNGMKPRRSAKTVTPTAFSIQFWFFRFRCSEPRHKRALATLVLSPGFCDPLARSGLPVPAMKPFWQLAFRLFLYLIFLLL